MLRSIFTQWLAAQITPEIQTRLRETATESLREAFSGAVQAQTELDTQQNLRTVETGMVFATGREDGCLTDRMTGTRVTHGAGFKYTDGILANKRTVLVESGVGPERAADAAEALLQIFRPRRVISAGFSGALVPTLRRPQIVVPRTIFNRTTREALDLWTKLLAGPVQEGAASDGTDTFDRRFAAGTLVTSEEIVASPKEKKALAAQFGASLVDMEGFAVGRVCQHAGVPFLSVRVILDEVDEVLPHDLKKLSDASRHNTVRMLGALFSTVTSRPSSLVDMYRLSEKTLIAADALADALVEILKLS